MPARARSRTVLAVKARALTERQSKDNLFVQFREAIVSRLERSGTAGKTNLAELTLSVRF